jgi:hypothetical protein
MQIYGFTFSHVIQNSRFTNEPFGLRKLTCGPPTMQRWSFLDKPLCFIKINPQSNDHVMLSLQISP